VCVSNCFHKAFLDGVKDKATELCKEVADELLDLVPRETRPGAPKKNKG
jgi:hypothetical protein